MTDEQRRQHDADDPRVRFAGERTLLAWVRTGLAMMGFGFVVARFGFFLHELAQPDQARPATGYSLWIGTGLVVLGVAAILIAAVQHSRFLRGLDRGEPFVAPRWSLAIAVAVMLAAIGIGMIAYLLTLNR